ncbi:hypothetical protein AOL_s00210g165 [Orbilia oligospora ATCC 24927]|uniref:Uncharacterized protein n=1 Tax=Arthrobotrys oligospora (strain ATCC 24927 / CBS 115.81 / DSM 1491) TaxID=756982 RepID=G1XS07_ARTOA|nr:hypothetical protein AOL_s00210g165 [Orbilia oligospora ATCC 24927]EGX44004.1 hypothetical protein AOL_s00210g165 [Orbilia oligospora ATCC 24927]
MLAYTQRPSNSSTVLRCCAFDKKGSDCEARVFQPERSGHTLCLNQHHEYKKLYKSYKLKHEAYDRITQINADADTDAKKNIETKIGLGKEALSLRNQVNRRFFSTSQDNRSHVHEILRLQSEVDDLEEKLRKWEANCKGPAESGTARGTSNQEPELVNESPQAKTTDRVWKSLLDPTIPKSRLGSFPSDNPIIAIKDFLTRNTKLVVRELYSIVPSLNDSLSPILDEEASNIDMKPELDIRDIIIRFVFREFLIYKADSRELLRATRAQTIDSFLQESFIDDIEEYIKFFKAFVKGRFDTFWFLRDAVCDFLLDSQPSSTTTCILGVEIAMENAP